MFGAWRRLLGAWVWLAPIGLALSLFAGAVVALIAPPTYTATRQVLFLSKPTSNPELGEVNPFLAFGSSLYTAASVVAIMVTDERSAEDILGGQSNAEYTVGEQPGGTVPVLNIEAKAPTQEAVDKVADTVVATIATELEEQQRQAKAPKETWIVSSLIGSSLGPHRIWKQNVLMGIAAVIAVCASTFLLLLAVSWAKRLRARRNQPLPYDLLGEDPMGTSTPRIRVEAGAASGSVGKKIDQGA